MTCIPVKLKTADDAFTFVQKIRRYPFNMDLRWDTYQINAKSMLGVVGLSVGEKVILYMDTNESKSVLKDISQYIEA